MAARIFIGPMETSKVFAIDDAVDAGLTAEGFEFDEVADLDAFGDVGLGVGVVLVGAGGVGDDGGVELFENSRRRVAMRRSESRAIFCARALSSMALTVSRSW